MSKKYKVLILGASYGSLLASKLLMAGHSVSLVCRQNTADLINNDGTRVRARCPASSTPLPPSPPSPASTTSSAWPCRSRSTAPRACVN
jgi:ketopantoate reductase